MLEDVRREIFARVVAVFPGSAARPPAVVYELATGLSLDHQIL